MFGNTCLLSKLILVTKQDEGDIYTVTYRLGERVDHHSPSGEELVDLKRKNRT